VEHAERLRYEMQHGKAAHHVEGAVVEGEVERVTAHVDGTVAAVVADGTLHHRYRVVQPDDEPVLGEQAREEAGEVSRTARDVEHPLPAAEMQCSGGGRLNKELFKVPALCKDGRIIVAHATIDLIAGKSGDADGAVVTFVGVGSSWQGKALQAALAPVDAARRLWHRIRASR
jgi:hypothetical protein